MRSNPSSLVLLFCVATGAAFAACDGDTVTNPSTSGGSEGGGGAASSSASSTSSTTSSTTGTGSTTSSTTGGGGGDICDRACQRADDCGSSICNVLPVDCADPRFECAAQCILDVPECEDINLQNSELIDCVSACQGGQGGGGGAGGGGDCRACALENGCLTDCVLDGTCQPWARCAQSCFESDPRPECFADCNTQFPSAEEGYQQVYSCVCMSCTDSCETIVDPCNARR